MCLHTLKISPLLWSALSAVTEVLLPLGRVSLWELRRGVLLGWSGGAVLGVPGVLGVLEGRGNQGPIDPIGL